ncbi:M23 family metallopeptidase [Nannocystaceae bacterium ST9]
MPTGCPADDGEAPLDAGGGDEFGDEAESGSPSMDLPDDGACDAVPAPWLPFPAGTSMGITQKPGCDEHQGNIKYGYDFNVMGTYETDNDLVAVASSNGTVVSVVAWVIVDSGEDNGGWGNCVIVQIEDSCVYERYCHLDEGPDSIFVVEGDYVCAGTPLGLIGSTGDSTGPHLHWQREDANHQSLPVESFVELDVPDGCEQCEINDNSSGCFASQNVASCDDPPASPCAGLPAGDYCGFNAQLDGYAGDPSDLVTCDQGQVVNVTPCEYGCDEMPPGTDDECSELDEPSCGNGVVDPGEQCDSGTNGQTCAGLGFDEGDLICDECQFDTSGCCDQAHSILAAEYPIFTDDEAGCALNGGVQLGASAELAGSTIRFHVRKTDDSVWAQPAQLSLYVGVGPTCGDPPNVIKAQGPVVVGQVTQTLELGVDPYDAAWAQGETKEFWVGKSEGGFAATRSSGTISIQRVCE